MKVANYHLVFLCDPRDTQAHRHMTTAYTALAYHCAIKMVSESTVSIKVEYEECATLNGDIAGDPIQRYERKRKMSKLGWFGVRGHTR